MANKHKNLIKALIMVVVFAGTAYTYAVYSGSINNYDAKNNQSPTGALSLLNNQSKQGSSFNNSLINGEGVVTQHSEDAVNPNSGQINTRSELTETKQDNTTSSKQPGQVQGQTIVETPPAQSPKPNSQTVEPTSPIPTTIQCTGNFSTQLLCLINQYRSEKGLGRLGIDTAMSAVALSHSNWMNNTGNFSHEGVNGSKMFERCAVAGIQCLAENLAYNVKSPEEVIKLWKQNAGHNKNLLGPYTTTGIGISGKYLTLIFN